MSTSPDSVSYSQTIAELLAPAVAPDWSNTDRPDQPTLGMFGIARETGAIEFWDGSEWASFVSTNGATFTGPLHMGANTIDGSAIAFTGGTLNGVTIGGTTRAAGSFTTLAANGITTLGATTVSATGLVSFANAAHTMANGASLNIPNTASLSSSAITLAANTTVASNRTFTAGATTVGSTFTYSGTTTKALNSTANVSGTATGAAVVNNFVTNVDTVDASGAAGGVMTLLNATQNAGGVAMKGGRLAFGAGFNLTATSGNTGGATYVGGTFSASAGVNDNGTSTSYKSSIFGLNSTCHLGPGATYWGGVVGYEADFRIEAGASIQDKLGIHVTQIADDAVQGQHDDVAMFISNQLGAVGWRYGFSFGRFGANFGIDPTGTLIWGCDAYGTAFSVARGIDWRLGNFSKAGLAFKGGSWDDTNGIRLGTGYVTAGASGLTINSTGSIGASATVSSGGTGYPASSTVYGMHDGYGGLWNAAVNASGVITSVALVAAPYVTGATPANPITLTVPYPATTGSGATINITWTTGTKTTLTGDAQVSGAVILGSSGPTITTGSAVPSSTQPKGSVYLRTGGAVGSTLYVSQGGGTWNAVAGV